MIRLFSTGGRAGKTFRFRDFVFERGVCKIEEGDVGSLEYLRRNLEVKTEFELSSDDIEKQIAVAKTEPANGSSGIQSDSGGVSSPLHNPTNNPSPVASVERSKPDAAETTGPANDMATKRDGQEDRLSSDPSNGKALRAAILLLDPADDNSWTNTGLPALIALQAQFPEVTRGAVNIAASDLTRNRVREIHNN